MKDETVITVVGFVCLTTVLVTALSLGYDEFLLYAILGIIASGMGIALPQPKFLRK